MVPSNYEVKVVGETKEQFELAMKLAFQAWDKTVAWSVMDNTLFLYWSDPKGDANKFPFEMDVNDAINFCWSWLQKTDNKSSYPDIDGSVEDGGFELNYLDVGWCYYFVSIKKVWMEFHK